MSQRRKQKKTWSARKRLKFKSFEASDKYQHGNLSFIYFFLFQWVYSDGWQSPWRPSLSCCPTFYLFFYNLLHLVTSYCIYRIYYYCIYFQSLYLLVVQENHLHWGDFGLQQGDSNILLSSQKAEGSLPPAQGGCRDGLWQGWNLSGTWSGTSDMTASIWNVCCSAPISWCHRHFHICLQDYCHVPPDHHTPVKLVQEDGWYLVVPALLHAGETPQPLPLRKWYNAWGEVWVQQGDLDVFLCVC